MEIREEDEVIFISDQSFLKTVSRLPADPLQGRL